MPRRIIHYVLLHALVFVHGGLGYPVTFSPPIVVPLWYSSTDASRDDVKLRYPQSSTIERNPTVNPINSSLNLPPLSFKGRYLEDRVAAELFFFNTSNGLMVEVGANDGYIFSSSYVFDKELNWRTVIIEGDPIIASQSAQFRPNALSINAIVCDAFRLIHFSPMGAVGGIVETMSNEFISVWHPSLIDINIVSKSKLSENSTLENNLPESNRIASATENNISEDLEHIPVAQCVPLGWILEKLKLKQIDFMTIDIVGAEFQALTSIDFSAIRIDVLAISADPISEPKIYQFMSELGYIYWNVNILTPPPISWKTESTRGHQINWFVRADFIPSALSPIS